MKKVWLFPIMVLVVLASCSKKSQPASSQTHVKKEPAALAKTPVPQAVSEEPPRTTATPSVVPDAFPDPMVVIDANGNIVTPGSQLPKEIAVKTNYRSIARSFTPGQRKNLIYRFQMVPPRVLFVPEKLTSKSARGVYIIFKKKFWYWQKNDGLFHLDETYYQ